MHRNRKLLAAVALSLLIVGAGCGEEKGDVYADARNTSYEIDGHTVALHDGVAVEKTGDGASQTTTRVFGEAAKGDLGVAGKTGWAQLLTRDGGGSGTMFYVAAGLEDADGGYTGLNAVFLGDRIAPQNARIIEGQIEVNFAERRPGEPFTAAPSVGVTKWFEVKDGRLVEVTLRAKN